MKNLSLFLMLLAFSFGFAQPTTNAPTPTHLQANVVSVFSDAYTNVATNYNPFWGQSGAVNPTFEAVAASGNNVLAYTNFNYQGTEVTAQNLSAMEYLHVDIWTNASPASSIVQVSPVNAGGVGEFLVTINHVQGNWYSVDIPKSAFTGMTWNNVIQMKFAANGAGSATPIDIYLDNIYFWKAPVDPTTDATLSDLKVNGTTVAGFSSAITSYTVESPATPLPVVTATTTQATATAVVTQATAVPGSATVLVTSSNGTTKTYTVNFTLPVGPQVSANNPIHPNTDVVLSLFNDKPGYTNAYAAEGEFGTRTLVNLDAENDQTIKMDFSAAGWGQYDNTPPSVATAGYLHFSYYVPNVAPGANGHGFYIMLNSGSGEKLFTVKPTGGNATMVFDSWQTVSIPMSHFTTQGFNASTGVLSWKLGSDSDLNTKLVWFDNIFFTQSVLGTNESQVKTGVRIYPNPVTSGETIFADAKVKNIEIYNMAGQKVKTAAAQSISSQGLSKGVYVLKTTNEKGETQSSKLIVK